MRIATFVVLFLFCISFAAAQTVYKSIGPDGRVSYSDKPPTQGTLQEKIEIEDLPDNSALPPAMIGDLERIRRAPGSAPARLNGTLLFSASWCGYCRKARSYMAGRGIPFTEIDIETTDGKMAFAQAGGSGIPLLLANGRRIQGFDSATYDSVFPPR
jgi:glutaredoxin